MKNNEESLGGIILLGGKSKRMGADKYLLPFFNSTLIEHLIKELTRAVDNVLLVTNEPEKLAFLSHDYVTDILGEPCALSGIHAGLVHSKHRYNFVLACDLPFFSYKLVSLMSAHIQRATAIVVPKTENGLETLCGFYSKECIPVIENLFHENIYSVQELYSRVTTSIVDAKEFEEKIHHRLFFNMNSPSDYEKALAELAHKSE